MTPLLSRFLALGLTLLLALALILGVVFPIHDRLQTGQMQIADLEDQLQAFRARQGQVGAARSVVVQDRALIATQSESLAAARVQEILERAVAATDATLNSRSVDRGVPFEAWTRLPASLDVMVAPSSLQRLLYQLESKAPYLFIDRLDIRPQKRDGRAILSVRIDLHALMQKPSP